MNHDSMHLKLLLPYAVLVDEPQVKRIVVTTTGGSYGIWPNRLDCATCLAPGILTYETDKKEEKYIAVDEGILVKTRDEVTVTVHNAIAGVDLGSLHQAVERDFLEKRAAQSELNTALTKLERSFVRSFNALKSNS
ncbi:MAG: F0F1 ATP synthase subunit epsilon [Saprospiraceae bacterium]|nr:F0F1 ATP synthase subunit epsilon [Saprospiraceae bacterium]HQU53471.1 F0F1 ATP synthase subunit epsilon [Saprospiraceae bacterium]